MSIFFGFEGQVAGDYSDSHFLEVIFDQSRGWELSGQFDSFIITEFGDVGETVDGNFSGVLQGQQVDGDFSILRQ